MMSDEELDQMVDFKNALVTFQGHPARVVCTNRRCPRGRYRFVVLWECGKGEALFERSVTVDSFGKNTAGDRVVMTRAQYDEQQALRRAKDPEDYSVPVVN